MVNRASCLGGIVSMAVLLAAMTPSVRGGTASPEDRPDLFRALAAPTQTADLRESLDAYLDPEGAGRLTGWRAIQAAWLQTAEVISPSGQSSTIIFAAAGEPVEPVTSPSGFAFPETVGRPLNTADAPGIPFGNTALLTLAPGGFGRVILGQPEKGANDWTRSGKTAISYIRPNVNVQMMLALQVPGAPNAGRFEGPGFDSRALLSVGQRTRVDSAEVGTRTDSFGYFAAAPLVEDEPQTALAVGLDLGILPTFLSQMGLNVSVVASRSSTSGNLTVALVGTTELPIDWIPRERPENHPTGYGPDPLVSSAGDTFAFQSSSVGGRFRGGGIGGGGGGGGGGGERFIPIVPGGGGTPIIPVIPEPATMGLLAMGLALAAGRRRRRA